MNAPTSTETEPLAESDAPRQNSFVRFCKMALALLRACLALLADIFGAFGRRRARKPRPWHMFIGSKATPASLNSAQIERLLKRHQGLQDLEKIATVSANFRLPECDFFADPRQVERLLLRFLEENPPWLHINRVLSGGEEGAEDHSEEFLWREQEVREMEDVTLFLPDDSWRDRPLASLTMRPARALHEVWQARLLDQVLPFEILVDRFQRGEVLIPIHNSQKQRLEFRTEPRRMEIVTRKQVSIPIEAEGGSGKGGQLLYILLDYSASMQGKSAVLAMAVITATLRAHMGQRETRYLFRRYAQREELWPHFTERPIEAVTLQEKDALLDTILATNFKGSSTDVNDALSVAVKDIERLRLSHNLNAEILLVTDGRAEMLESARLGLLRAQVKVHTVMVVPEPNPGLEALSESFTALDINPDEAVVKQPTSTASSPTPRPRRAYQI